MCGKTIFPKVPSILYVTLELHHAQRVARCYPTSQEFQSYRWIQSFCVTFKMLACFREAYNDIICTAFENSSITSIILSWDESGFGHNTLLMDVLLSRSFMWWFFVHLISISKYFLFQEHSVIYVALTKSFLWFEDPFERKVWILLEVSP